MDEKENEIDLLPYLLRFFNDAPDEYKDRLVESIKSFKVKLEYEIEFSPNGRLFYPGIRKACQSIIHEINSNIENLGD